MCWILVQYLFVPLSHLYPPPQKKKKKKKKKKVHPCRDSSEDIIIVKVLPNWGWNEVDKAKPLKNWWVYKILQQGLKWPLKMLFHSLKYENSRFCPEKKKKKLKEDFFFFFFFFDIRGQNSPWVYWHILIPATLLFYSSSIPAIISCGSGCNYI